MRACVGACVRACVCVYPFSWREAEGGRHSLAVRVAQLVLATRCVWDICLWFKGP